MYIKNWKTAVERPARSIEEGEEGEEVEEEKDIPPKSWRSLMRDAARGTSSIYLPSHTCHRATSFCFFI